jgi:hypothetical protein
VPLRLSWKVTNHTNLPILVPADLRIEAQHVQVAVVGPSGTVRPMPSFVIRTDPGTLTPLAPGESRQGETSLFWSSKGFAFEQPGRHRIEVHLIWATGNVRYGVQASTDIWVDYPTSESDNQVAATLLHPEVGKFVALGGAPHLEQGVARINEVLAKNPEHPATRFLMALPGHKGSKARKE